MNPFFGPPPTPEEIEAAKKKRAEDRLAVALKVKAALPHLKAAQLELREAASFGLYSERLTKASRHLAIIIEDSETDLVRPA